MSGCVLGVEEGEGWRCRGGEAGGEWRDVIVVVYLCLKWSSRVREICLARIREIRDQRSGQAAGG